MKATVELTDSIVQAVLFAHGTEQGAYNKGWAWWAWDGAGSVRSVLDGTLCVEVVEVQGKTYDSYGEVDEGELSIIFKVTADDDEVVHYRKIGSASSYGDDEWNGTFKRVNPVVKTVYEYK